MLNSFLLVTSELKMKKAAGAGSLSLVCLVVFGIVGVCQGGELRKNFYRDSCKSAEDIVRSITWKNAASNPDLPAKLIRMHFHDCFVRVIKYYS